MNLFRCENIDRKRGNINPKSKTSTRAREYQPEIENIDRKRGNIAPSAGTSARNREHRPETRKHQLEIDNMNTRVGYKI